MSVIINNTMNVSYKGADIEYGDFNLRSYRYGFTDGNYDFDYYRYDSYSHPGNNVFADKYLWYGDIYYRQYVFDTPIILVPWTNQSHYPDTNGAIFSSKLWTARSGQKINILCNGAAYDYNGNVIQQMSAYPIGWIDLDNIDSESLSLMDLSQGIFFHANANALIDSRNTIASVCWTKNQIMPYSYDLDYQINSDASWLQSLERQYNYDDYGVVNYSLRNTKGSTVPVANMYIAFKNTNGEFEDFKTSYIVDYEFKNPLVWDSSWIRASSYFYGMSGYEMRIPMTSEAELMSDVCLNYTWTSAEQNAANNA